MEREDIEWLVQHDAVMHFRVGRFYLDLARSRDGLRVQASAGDLKQLLRDARDLDER